MFLLKVYHQIFANSLLDRPKFKIYRNESFDRTYNGGSFLTFQKFLFKVLDRLQFQDFVVHPHAGF